MQPRSSTEPTKTLWRAARLTALLLLLSGVAFPLLLRGVARVAFPSQTSGSLVRDTAGRVVGSSLIGQSFTLPRYFHGRPSAAAYNATASTGSNLGPNNPQLIRGNGGSFAGAESYARAYRAENGLPADAELPVDAVTASGSGLDPHISVRNAELQLERVLSARASMLSRATLTALVRSHTEARTLWVIGEPRINVLLLNLAIDSASAARMAPAARAVP